MRLNAELQAGVEEVCTFSHVFPYVLLVSVAYDIPRRTFGTCSLQAALQDGAIRAEKEAHGEGSGDVS